MEQNNPLLNNEFYQKGISSYRKKNYAYAIELFSEVLKDYPDFEECRRYLWKSIRQNKILNPDSLIILIAKKIKTAFLWQKLLLLQLLNKFDAAILINQEIILIDPNYIPALFKFSLLLSKKGDTAQALSVLEEIIILDKNNIAALKILSKVYYENKSYPKAKLTAMKLLELLGHNIQAENILKDISALGTIEKGFNDIKPAT